MWLTLAAGQASKGMNIRRKLLQCEIMNTSMLNLRINTSGLGLVGFQEITLAETK